MNCLCRTRLLLCCTALVVSPSVGCRREAARLEKDAAESGIELQELSAESARKALIEMIEGGEVERHDFLKLLLPSLKTDAVDSSDPALGTGEIQIGEWRCNLRNATFGVTMTFPKADFHAFNSWNGVFERTAEGKWRAKITSFQSAQRGRGGPRDKQ